MLGYTMDDLDNMINAVHDAKLFYLKSNGPDEDMGDKGKKLCLSESKLSELLGYLIFRKANYKNMQLA